MNPNNIYFREADDNLNWLHDRMPAILPDEEAVSAWLDPNLHGIEALRVLRPIPKESVSWQHLFFYCINVCTTLFSSFWKDFRSG